VKAKHAAVALIAVLAIATAVWWLARPTRDDRPPNGPPAVAVPEAGDRAVPVSVKQLPPEPPPAAIIRGVTGFRYSGGPPADPKEPRPWVTYPSYGFGVSVFEKESGKKVAETVSKSDGLFEVKVQPGTYRVVLHYRNPDHLSGKSTFEQIVEAKPDKPVELDLYQAVNVP
jgi:hypothetical protein